MTYAQYSDFEKHIIKEQLGNEKTRYLGTSADLIANKQVGRPIDWSQQKIMSTPNTTRACRGCWGTRYRSNQHSIGNHWSLIRCPDCYGTGRVFG